MNEKERGSQIDRISIWSNAVLDYLLLQEPNSDSSKYFRNLIPQLVESDDLRGLKHVFSDLREFVSLLPPEYQVELDLFLREKIGRGLFAEIRNKNKRIALILKRGRVADEDEYRALSERLNDVTRNSKKTAEINRLLYEYRKSR